MGRIKGLLFYLIILVFTLGLVACKENAKPIPQHYIDAITEYKNNLKDPTSMRIYGNILVANFTEDGSCIISMVCDAKNSYGGYGGKDTVEVALFPELDTLFFDSESQYFFDIRSTYEEQERLTELGRVSSEKQAELDSSITFEMISGEEVAKAIGAEYFPV